MPIIPFFIQKKNIKLQVFNLFDVLINTLYNEGYDQTLERSCVL